MKPSFLLIALSFLALSNASAAVPGASILTDLIFQELDIDGNKTIDKEEWQTGLDRGFIQLDFDGDGSVATSELDMLPSLLEPDLGTIAANIAGVIVKKALLLLDDDDDNIVSRTEFDHNSGKLLKKVDTDEDGKVTSTELLEIPTLVLGG